MEKKIDRLVEVKDLTKRKGYEDSVLFCDVTLTKEMTKDGANGSISTFGLTRIEAEDLHAKLWEILGKNKKI